MALFRFLARIMHGRMWLKRLNLCKNLVVEADLRDFNPSAAFAMNDPMLPLPGLSSASGKPVVVKFDGGLLSSDGGVLALREVEERLRVCDLLAACDDHTRAADYII